MTSTTPVWTRWARPGEQAQADGGLFDGFGLAEDAAADADDGVGGKDQRTGKLGLGPGEGDRGEAFSSARRLARLRGSSLFFGVSSMVTGMTRSGSTPIWASKAKAPRRA